MRRSVTVGVSICSTALLAGAGRAQVATFDELSEGFAGLEFTSGGITFFDPRHAGEDPYPFAIEDVSVILPSIPGLGEHFSSPNVLTLAGFGYGPETWFIARIEQIKMTTFSIQTYARMDVFFNDLDLFTGTEVVLDALLDGAVVGSDSFIIPGLANDVVWNELEISGIAFDTLRLHAVGGIGGPDDNGFLGSIDNVQIIPAPAGLLALAGMLPRRGRAARRTRRA